MTIEPRKSGAAILATALLLSPACSTLATKAVPEPDNQIGVYYSGASNSIRVWKEHSDIRTFDAFSTLAYPFFSALMLVDLVCSTIGDTLFLPIDYFARDPAAERDNDKNKALK
jgi:uncharacterized protein YceK